MLEFLFTYTMRNNYAQHSIVVILATQAFNLTAFTF